MSKAVRDTARNLRDSRKADFDVTNDVNAALFSNLRKLSKGQGKKLTRFNQKRVGQLQASQERMAGRGRRTVRRFNKDSGPGREGGLLTGAISVMSGDLRTVAKAGTKAAKGQVKSGKIVAQSGKEMVNIFEAGAKEVSANADMMAATALKERAAADATTVAQMAHDERLLKMEQAFQAKMAKKEYDRQVKLMGLEEEKARKELGATFGQVRPQVAVYSKMVPEVLTMIQENPELTITEIIETLMETGTIGPEDAQSPIVRTLVNNLMTNNNPGAENLANEFIEAMALSPVWSAMSPKARKRLKSYIESTLSTTQASYAAGAYKQEEGGGFDLGGFLHGKLQDLPAPGSPSALEKFLHGQLSK